MLHLNRRPIEPTMIRGTNVNIKYANLNMTNQLNEADRDRGYALDLLRSNCSLAALVDANERYDPPRCAEATRRHIIQETEDWARHDGLESAPSSIFWLHGGAGVGKSALAQTLAENFKTNEDLAASFFFFKSNANRNNGDRLIPTLTLQLVRSFQGLAPFVEEKILQNPDLFQSSRQTQMLELLIGPLMRLSLKESDRMQSLKVHPRLIVIDGLDECLNSKTQCDLLRIISSAIPHFPYPLRFLITSRPESHITRAFQYDIGEVAKYDLSNDADADADIRTFLEGEFAKIRRTHPLSQHLPSHWPPRSDVNSIVERSSGHFIYASTVIRFIQSPKHHPVDRLQVIVGFKQAYEKDRPYDRLDSLYRLIFLEVPDPIDLEKIHLALGMVHLRSLKVGLFARGQWRFDRFAIEVLLELRSGDLVLLFDPLLSLVAFSARDIRIFHKSLFDYLLDSSRSGDLYFDLGLAHESIANHILKKLQDGWDLAEFQDFAYHCQFARLNDALTGYLRSLASDPKITFTMSLPRMLAPPPGSSLIQSTLYFLQVFGRQDFDSSGYHYRMYVKRKNRWLRPAIPWSRRLKCMISRSMRVGTTACLESNLCSSLQHFFGRNDIQQRCANGFNGRTIPSCNKSVIKFIKQEHGMFSSYVKMRHRNAAIVISFLEQSAGLIHSCHFVIRRLPSSINFVMLVTYTESGVRLSCSEVDCFSWPYGLSQNITRLVEKHLQNSQKAVDDNVTTAVVCSA